MNCQEFESRVDTLARGALTDARRRAEASAHEESCAACAARLADERALSTGLRALASGMKGAEAPPRVEAALLAAFRARAASKGAEDSSRAGVNADAGACVRPPTSSAPVRHWSWVKTAAAATLAAAASLALFVLVRPGAGVDAPRRGGAGAAQRAMIEPPPGSAGGQTAPQVAQGETKADEGDSPSEIHDAAAPAPDTLRDRTPRASFSPRARALNASLGGGGARPASNAGAQEIATEFIPLTQGVPYAASEEGHLIRVELPRSALASFGLPVNAEAAGGRVKADVLLGEDGIARAIRFIR